MGPFFKTALNYFHFTIKMISNKRSRSLLGKKTLIFKGLTHHLERIRRKQEKRYKKSLTKRKNNKGQRKIKRERERKETKIKSTEKKDRKEEGKGRHL